MYLDKESVRVFNFLVIVKVIVEGKDILEVVEGNGLILVLDIVLWKVLRNFYFAIVNFYLIDYKVRILDSGVGIFVNIRVLIELSNG